VAGLVEGPLILGKKRRNHRTKKNRQGKQNKTASSPLPPPTSLSSRSGSATGLLSIVDEMEGLHLKGVLLSG